MAAKMTKGRVIRIVVVLTFVLFFQLYKYIFNSDDENGAEDTKFDKAHYAQVVKHEFLHAWNGYKKYAWGHDALKPLSKTARDWYDVSLYMTPLDAFDTMILMNLTSEANDAKKLILENLSFDHDFYVQNFEITIRILGGLLSAYELDGDLKFLELADDLGTRLLPVFNSKTGMPYREVNLRTGAVRGSVNNPAEIGTLILEFGKLSKLTGKPEYFEKAKKAVAALEYRKSEIGLVGTTIDVNTGKWLNTQSHISGMIDSYYEYLLKGAILFGDEDLRKMWENGSASVNKYLADITENGLWYSHVDLNTGERLSTQFGALDAFFPAVLALGGNQFRAKKLTESAFKMWQLKGIEPEQLDYSTMTILAPQYHLRPELIESIYYMFHYTGEQKYLDMGVTVLESIIKNCKTDEAYAGLSDVTTMEQADEMESFFFAETLKYLYLLFAPPETLEFDNYIFNTEAHPLKRG